MRSRDMRRGRCGKMRGRPGGWSTTTTTTTESMSLCLDRRCERQNGGNAHHAAHKPCMRTHRGVLLTRVSNTNTR